jgi:hypothetical protein
MIASSTIIPETKTKETKTTSFILVPVDFRKMREQRKENGMPKAARKALVKPIQIHNIKITKSSPSERLLFKTPSTLLI